MRKLLNSIAKEGQLVLALTEEYLNIPAKELFETDNIYKLTDCITVSKPGGLNLKFDIKSQHDTPASNVSIFLKPKNKINGHEYFSPDEKRFIEGVYEVTKTGIILRGLSPVDGASPAYAFIALLNFKISNQQALKEKEDVVVQQPKINKALTKSKNVKEEKVVTKSIELYYPESKMPKINAQLKKEAEFINMGNANRALEIVQNIASFLKENKLSIGYTSGTTSSLLTNYQLGISAINPMEYDLIAERNIIRTSYWGIMLDKDSFQKTYDYLKKNKISKSVLDKNNIKILYDNRLDKIKKHKKYSYTELSKLAADHSQRHLNFYSNDINKYCYLKELNENFPLSEFWMKQLTTNSYAELVKKYSFLKTKNDFNLILFQEEWLQVVQKITEMKFSDLMLLLYSIEKAAIKTQKLLKKSLKENFYVPEKDAKLITTILLENAWWLHCKAHIVSNAYIDLITA